MLAAQQFGASFAPYPLRTAAATQATTP